jgi:methylthioribose-1-phosphate isomerase
VTIEERDSEEVTKIEGLLHGKIEQVRICPEDARAANYGFDITPARLITGIITEKGICSANENSIKEMFSDKLI